MMLKVAFAFRRSVYRGEEVRVARQVAAKKASGKDVEVCPSCFQSFEIQRGEKMHDEF